MFTFLIFSATQGFANDCGEIYLESPLTVSSGGQTGGDSDGDDPVSGDKPDLTPDFDVYHKDGHEISADCLTCSTEDVLPGQVVTMRFETETHNRDAESSDTRSNYSGDIDGIIKLTSGYCKITLGTIKCFIFMIF